MLVVRQMHLKKKILKNRQRNLNHSNSTSNSNNDSKLLHLHSYFILRVCFSLVNVVNDTFYLHSAYFSLDLILERNVVYL